MQISLVFKGSTKAAFDMADGGANTVVSVGMDTALLAGVSMGAGAAAPCALLFSVGWLW